ncbi:MAG TPA: glutathione S-transferase family protein [Myxococcaceae bacterium]|nr:glutathione S-transferase family protein [Myxococcaceae bacterium]
MLKLFGHDASPYVRRVRIVLAELRIPFERDTHGWQDPAPEFTAASPIMRVPMLDLGPGARVRHVFESRVISALLFEMPHPHPEGDPPFQDALFDPALALLDQNVVSVADAAQDSLVNVFLLENDGIRADQAPYLQRQVTRARGCLDWLEATYKGRRSLNPARLAYADVAVMSLLGWIRFRKRLDLAPWTGLLALEAAHAARPSLASTRPA